MLGIGLRFGSYFFLNAFDILHKQFLINGIYSLATYIDFRCHLGITDCRHYSHSVITKIKLCQHGFCSRYPVLILPVSRASAWSCIGLQAGAPRTPTERKLRGVSGFRWVVAVRDKPEAAGCEAVSGEDLGVAGSLTATGRLSYA